MRVLKLPEIGFIFQLKMACDAIPSLKSQMILSVEINQISKMKTKYTHFIHGYNSYIDIVINSLNN